MELGYEDIYTITREAIRASSKGWVIYPIPIVGSMHLGSASQKLRGLPFLQEMLRLATGMNSLLPEVAHD